MEPRTPKQHRHTDVEHFFRHEYGRIVALLAGKFTFRHIDLIEDAVQEALLKAMQLWSYQSPPPNPPAWIYRVAHNGLIDTLRRRSKQTLLEDHHLADLQAPTAADGDRDGEELLKMIFACCHPVLSPTEQIMLSLKLLCGFSVRELAAAFMKSPAAVKRSITRAKSRYRERIGELALPASSEMTERLESVYHVIYQLFTRGYKLSDGHQLLNRDICAEAIRLGQLQHAHRQTPELNALLGLMCLNFSRFDARADAEGNLVTLEHQDRNLWDRGYIEMGFQYLQQSNYGVKLTVYHLEAGIAAHHVAAPDFASTNWEAILLQYDLLMKMRPTPFVALNRVVALNKVKGAGEAMRELDRLGKDRRLVGAYLFHAIRGDVAICSGDVPMARAALQKAVQLADNEVEKRFLEQRLSELDEA